MTSGAFPPAEVSVEGPIADVNGVIELGQNAFNSKVVNTSEVIKANYVQGIFNRGCNSTSVNGCSNCENLVKMFLVLPLILSLTQLFVKSAQGIFQLEVFCW
jgi:hypothetical protein